MTFHALLAVDVEAPNSSDSHLIIAALLGIAAVVLLITVLKVHPFLALILGGGVMGIVAGLTPENTITSFTNGVGTTVGGVGLLIALGAMIGGLLAESGGADRIVDTVVNKVHGRWLPWAMAGVAALIGLPLFFEVGVVLLVPVVLLVATRTRAPLMGIAIPALAGLSVLHALVPPHPGPLAAIQGLNADLGLTLAFGLIIAVPTVIVAGPVFGGFIARSVPGRVPEALVPTRDKNYDEPGRRRPAFAAAVVTILTPVVLMLARAIGELTLDDDNGVRKALDLIGTPIIALLAGLILAMFLLGWRSGLSREGISGAVGGALPAIAGILLIVAAGGGFKQVLVDAGVGDVIADAAKDANLSPLILGWLVAVGIRLATGSATVATITAAGLVAPLAADLSRPEVALLVLAIGSGSVFFSHVNDAGFWLVKEYLGLSVGQTLKTWSVMETIISVVGLAGVLLISLLV